MRQREDIAAVLRLPLAAVCAVAGDVCGNFGIRNSIPAISAFARGDRTIQA